MALDTEVERHPGRSESFCPSLPKDQTVSSPDFAITLLLGAAWLAFLILSHASPGAIEVVFAFCFAYAIESLVDLILKSRGPSKYNTENS